jgi:hypothetical protein
MRVIAELLLQRVIVTKITGPGSMSVNALLNGKLSIFIPFGYQGTCIFNKQEKWYPT